MKTLDEVEDEFLEGIDGFIDDTSFAYELLTYIDKNYNLTQKQNNND